METHVEKYQPVNKKMRVSGCKNGASVAKRKLRRRQSLFHSIVARRI
jgi:hypothetical protein